MRIVSLTVLLLCACLATVSYGQQHDAERFMQEAYNKIQLSMQLMEQASELVRERPTAERLETAVNLAIRAGQGFEEAANMLRALGPEMVPESDIRNCEMAVQQCVEFIERCQEQLRMMR